MNRHDYKSGGNDCKSNTELVCTLKTVILVYFQRRVYPMKTILDDLLVKTTLAITYFSRTFYSKRTFLWFHKRNRGCYW